MTFDAVRQFGVTLFASAGVAGIIAGFASRPVLSNFIAGVQIAVSQPIRIDDAVIVENEWGNVEEITFSYVVVRLWDWRRMVVPLSYFIEKPFQNWTRTGGELIGTVFLYVDHTAPVRRSAKNSTEIAAQSKLWNGKVVNLQVSDCSETAIQLRALVSANSASAAWDLRCEVREKLIEFLQREYPSALPRRRYETLMELESEEPVAGSALANERLSSHHQRSGENRPAACSITAPSENSVSSANGLPISCKPSGRPCASRPLGTEMPGRPAMFTVTVKTSLRYISTGSARPFSPMAKAADGVVGVRMASMPAAKQSLEIALDQRAHLLRPQIISVVIAGGEHIGADHDAPAHFLAEAGRARRLVHLDDVAAGHAQPVAHAVIAREIGRRLGRRHDVIGRQRVFGVRQRNVDNFGAGVVEPLRAPLPQAPRSRPPCRACGIPWGCRCACPSPRPRRLSRSPAPAGRRRSYPWRRGRPSSACRIAQSRTSRANGPA